MIVRMRNSFFLLSNIFNYLIIVLTFETVGFMRETIQDIDKRKPLKIKLLKNLVRMKD